MLSTNFLGLRLNLTDRSNRSYLVESAISMNRRTLIYGIIYGVCGGLLIAFLKYIEYRFIVVEHSILIVG